jgi:hypothetical protein
MARSKGSKASSQDTNGETIGFGRLENVKLHKYFPSESRDFTPWLATPENIKLLGDAVGMELEVEALEKDVGPFRADILCKETNRSDWVIIENQLEPTDHLHLGQLLTYAAGLHASAIIWIAEKFRAEHRAALDFLNEITGENVAFFGIEVELLRIGSSPAAPRFNVICKPNEFSKGVVISSESRRAQFDFWTTFRDYLRENSRVIRPQKPFPQNWMNHPIGRGGCNLTSIFSFWDSETNETGGEVRAEVTLNGPDAKLDFEQLSAQKEEIEREIGEPLHWHNRPENRTCRIYLRHGCDVSDRSKWPEYHEWLKTRLEALHRVFVTRLRLIRSPKSLNVQREAEGREAESAKR